MCDNKLSKREVLEVIERAKREEWETLALIGNGELQGELYASLEREGLYKNTLFKTQDRMSPEAINAFSKLTNLKRLDLYHNGIDDQGAEMLSNLKNLTQLNLDHNWIGDQGAKCSQVSKTLHNWTLTTTT